MTFQSTTLLCGPFPFLITEWIIAVFNNMQCQALSRGIFLLPISFHFFSASLSVFPLSLPFTQPPKCDSCVDAIVGFCTALQAKSSIVWCPSFLFLFLSNDNLESLCLKSQILVCLLFLLIFVTREASKESFNQEHEELYISHLSYLEAQL